jgi:hypothetical protein
LISSTHMNRNSKCRNATDSHTCCHDWICICDAGDGPRPMLPSRGAVDLAPSSSLTRLKSWIRSAPLTECGEKMGAMTLEPATVRTN